MLLRKAFVNLHLLFEFAFTYYLLRELKDTKGNVTLKQLSDFVTDNVSKQSLIANGKTQTPTIFSSKSIANSWENWKLK